MDKKERENIKIELIQKIFKLAYENKEDDVFVEYSAHVDVLNVGIDIGGWLRNKNRERHEIQLNWDDEFGGNVIDELKKVIEILEG